MTDINHRRANKAPVNLRRPDREYHNGYAYPDAKHYDEMIAEHRAELDAQGKEDVRILGEARTGAPRIGRTDYLDKSMHGWGRKSTLADRSVGAGIGNDFTDGHRGMARSVKGAKKFVRTRIRFHENAATWQLAMEVQQEEMQSSMAESK